MKMLKERRRKSRYTQEKCWKYTMPDEKINMKVHGYNGHMNTYGGNKQEVEPIGLDGKCFN